MVWKVKKLGEVAYLAGRIGWKGLTAKEYTTSGPLFTSVHALNHGDYVDFREAFHISQERYDESPEIMLEPSDILICKDGAGIGKLGIISKLPGPATINSSLLLIRALKEIDAKFLYHALCSPSFQSIVQERIDGATTPHLYQREIREFPVPIPPLREQKRIVSILDDALEGITAAIANAEKNLANARELFDSYVYTTFCMGGDGWSKTTLGALCDNLEYGTATKSSSTGRVPVLRMGNIQDGNLDWDDLVYTDNVEEIRKYALKIGDVLFNRTNSAAHVGKAAIYRGEQPAIFAGYLIRIHRKEGCLDGEFLNYFLNSPIARDYGKSVMSQSVNQANISGSKLKEYPIATLSLSKQREIVAKLHRLKAHTSDLADIYHRKLVELQQLKTSILEKAFAGELTAQPERLVQEALV